MKHALLIAMWIVAVATSPLSAAWSCHTIDASSRGADGVRVADVNADGLPDITTAWEEGGTIRVYLNPGPHLATATWPAVTVGRVKSPEDAVFADLDGDGAADVVSCCEGATRTVYVHWAPRELGDYGEKAAWKTQAIPATAGQQMWMFALPIQLDGHGCVDLIVGSKGQNASIGWLQAADDPRNLSEWKFRPIYRAGWIMSLLSRDMDGDGDLDILASDRKGTARGVLWLENPGPTTTIDGTLWKEHRLGPGDREVMFLTVAQLGTDMGVAVVCAVKGRGVTIYYQRERGSDQWKVHEIQMPDGCGSGKGVALCDVDLDGRQDVVFTCEHATGGKSGVRWLSYRDTILDPVWQDHEISGPKGVKFDRIELLDLDHDGDLDVITCEERDNLGVIWYENPTRHPAGVNGGSN